MVSIRSDIRRDVLSGLREGFAEPDPDQAAFVAVGRVESALRPDPPSRARFLHRWEEADTTGPLDLTPAYVAVARAVAPEFDVCDATRFTELCLAALELSFDAETTALTGVESTEIVNAIALTLDAHHGAATPTAQVVGELLDHLRESRAWRGRVERLTSSDRSMLQKSLQQTRWTTAHVADWRHVGLATLTRGWESGSVSVDEPVWVRVADAEQQWRSALSAVLNIEIDDVAPTRCDLAPERLERRFESPPTTRIRRHVQERSTEQRLLYSVRSTLAALGRSRVEFARDGRDAVALDLLRLILADPDEMPTSAQLATKLTEHPAVFDVRCSQSDLAAHLDSVIDAARTSR